MRDYELAADATDVLGVSAFSDFKAPAQMVEVSQCLCLSLGGSSQDSIMFLCVSSLTVVLVLTRAQPSDMSPAHYYTYH